MKRGKPGRAVAFTGSITGVYATDFAFFVLQGNTGVCWGKSGVTDSVGADCSSVDFSGTIIGVYANFNAFFVLKADGTGVRAVHFSER